MAEGKVEVGYAGFEKRCQEVSFKKTNYGENVTTVTDPKDEIVAALEECKKYLKTEENLLRDYTKSGIGIIAKDKKVYFT